MNAARPETAPAPVLTLRAIRTRAVGAPMKRPLRTSAGSIPTAPLVLIDLETEEGVTGHSYLFAYRPSLTGPLQSLIAEMAGSLQGMRVAPAEIQRHAGAPYQLAGIRGLVGMALSGIDVACWDVLAQAAGMPLATMLGGQPSPIPAYNSNGLGIMPAGEAADEALELLDEGFPAVKVRLGNPTVEADVAVVREIRKRIPASATLMSDYNHSLSVTEALRRGRALDDEGLYWIEEPAAFDDFAGNALIAAALATPVQLGENFASVQEMATALTARAGDYVMPDLERIGGVTGWMKAAALAEAAGVEMSSHLFAEVSVHLLAVTPTRHWIEYVDWADAILAEPLVPTDGCLVASDRPGVGLAWDEDAIRHYLAD